MSTKRRQDDILKIIENLDIPPTLFNNAVEKYNSIAKYLQSKGLNVEIYPQGSFALGTVIRPYTQDDNAAYDLDFICQVTDVDKNNVSAEKLRSYIEEALDESGLYGGKLEICAECITIRYADVNGIAFSIDVVPAVDESLQKKAVLVKNAQNPDLIETAIAIPKQVQECYEWITNNPKGYKLWFDDINNRYLINNRSFYRASYFEKYSHVFASVEDIPSELERSALQRVIQILKYHRNVFYSRHKDGDKHKPISAIINTIVTEIAKHANPAWDVYELLKYVVNEFNTYSLQLKMNEILFAQKYSDKTVISKKREKWVIQNPANPEDNLADSWTNETAEIFFKWITNLQSDLIESLNLSDEDFRICVENALGEPAVKKTWGEKYKGIKKPTIIMSSTLPKPWRNI